MIDVMVHLGLSWRIKWWGPRPSPAQDAQTWREKETSAGSPVGGGHLKMKKDGWSLKGTQSSPEKAERSGIEGRRQKPRGDSKSLWQKRGEQGLSALLVWKWEGCSHRGNVFSEELTEGICFGTLPLKTSCFLINGVLLFVSTFCCRHGPFV